MRSISHWGMFESFDKEVRVAYSPEYLRQAAQAQAKLINSYQANAQNAIYQANNFGKLD